MGERQGRIATDTVQLSFLLFAPLHDCYPPRLFFPQYLFFPPPLSLRGRNLTEMLLFPIS